MKTFDYRRVDDPATAVAAVAEHPGAVFLGGGSNLVDHLKLGVARPDLVVDVSHASTDEVTEHDGGLRIGGAVRNSDLAAHPVVRQRYPVVARALLAGASGQIRHQATTAGNLLQRTRCVYFQDVSTPCHKREPGSGCAALEGHGRQNAILGASEHCVAVHPSDLAVALAAVDASVVVLGPDGERTVSLADFHRLPGDEPHRDTVLGHGEMVVAVDLPDLAAARTSTYVKVRERASYAFALVSVAAALELDGDGDAETGGTVRDLRLVWGGVAHKPWRATRAEEALRGANLSDDAVAAACDAELEAAQPGRDNGFKVPMVRNATVHALRILRGADDETDPEQEDA